MKSEKGTVKVSEQSEMENITTAMAECICDTICGKLYGVNEDKAEEICAECELGKHICNVINQYNKIDDFENTQAAVIKKKYSGIRLCRECRYRAKDENGYFWCRSANGIIGHSLGENDGCSIGEKAEGEK